MRFRKSVVAAVAVVAMMGAVGAAGAVIGSPVETTGFGDDPGVLTCPGGMTRLGHELNEDTSLFPGDPAVHVDVLYTVADDFFRVEAVDLGAHAGTHLDAPGHFIEGGRTVDDLAAEEFVWPAYVIDVRDMDLGEDNQLSIADIEAFEADNGMIQPGSLVIIQTGAEEFWGAEVVDEDKVKIKGNKNKFTVADNTDDLFDFDNAGFSGDAVQWLFDNREIDGVGSDAYGPDAASDGDFLATFTALANDGIALVALANLDSMTVNSDIIIASTVALTDGSGFSTDPIACHGVADGGEEVHAGDE